MTAPREPDPEADSGGSTSRSLLAEAKCADPAAWERLVKLYAPLMASLCRRWGIPEQDIADVLQDIFSAVAGHIDRFRNDRPADTFRGWLATIARNKVRDYFRRRSHEPMAAGGTEASLHFQQIRDPDSILGESTPSDNAIFDAVLLAALNSIRSEFHEQTWRAFWEVVVEGRTTADVADRLGMRPGTVRVAKSRVLLRLRKELGDPETGPA